MASYDYPLDVKDLLSRARKRGGNFVKYLGIEDELRLTDASGNPRTLSHAMRVVDPTTRTWKTTSLDAYRSSFASSVGEWKNGEMHTSSSGTDGEGKAFQSRSRYIEIKASSFRLPGTVHR